LLTLIHSLTIYKIPKEIKLQIEILDVLQANILHKTFQCFQNYLRFFKHDLHAQIIYSVIVSHAMEKKYVAAIFQIRWDSFQVKKDYTDNEGRFV
jgi:hypothetical protein